MKLTSFLVPLALPIAAACAACADVAAPNDEPGADADDVAVVFDGDPDDVLDKDGASPVQEAKLLFMRLGVRFTSNDRDALEVRTSADGDTWSEWQRPTLVFSEEDTHAGHVDVAGEPAQFFQYRVIEGREPPSFLSLEPIEMIGSNTAQPADVGVDAESVTAEQGLNVTIHSRSSWGARAPSCKSFTGVRMATIHHTDGANDDTTPVPRQLREIQAFHMFTRGWCDIGYNFLVSRDGQIWEGRGYGVMGAHTENANTDNMGISFLGNYMSVEPPLEQQVAAAKVLRYLHDKAGIPLSRSGSDGVKGHRQRGTTSTSCPGDALYAKLGNIVNRAKNKDFAVSPCSTGHFDGAYCDDDGAGGEREHDRLRRELHVDFHCDDKHGSPAFCPTASAKRQDAIFVLGAAAKMPLGGHSDAFPDDNHKREQYFDAAKDYGIVLGINGRAEPDRKVSRSSLAVLLTRMYRLPPATRDYFDDDDGDANEAAHNSAAAAGLFAGFHDRNGGRRDFKPRDIATRDTLAVVALRAHDKDLVPVWKLPAACVAGQFDGSYCDDDGKAIEEAHELLVARGVHFKCDIAGADAFCGSKEANRDNAIFALTQAAGIPLAGAPDAFNDDDGTAHERWFNAAKLLGIVGGYSGGTEVRAHEPANRDTIAILLSRIYVLPPATTDFFSDDNGTSSEAAHNKVAAAGLFSGFDDGHGGRAFKGGEPATRDTIAVVVKRAADAGLVPVWGP